MRARDCRLLRARARNTRRSDERAFDRGARSTRSTRATQARRPQRARFARASCLDGRDAFYDLDRTLGRTARGKRECDDRADRRARGRRRARQPTPAAAAAQGRHSATPAAAPAAAATCALGRASERLPAAAAAPYSHAAPFAGAPSGGAERAAEPGSAGGARGTEPEPDADPRSEPIAAAHA